MSHTLYELRRLAGLTQFQLGSTIQCTPSTISVMESSSYIPTKYLLKLMDLFDVPYIQGTVSEAIYQLLGRYFDMGSVPGTLVRDIG